MINKFEEQFGKKQLLLRNIFNYLVVAIFNIEFFIYHSNHTDQSILRKNILKKTKKTS